MRVTLLSRRPATVRVGVEGPRGSHELPAVVDTGASVTLIAPSVATDLGYDLRAAAKSEVQTVSGVEVMPRVVLDRVTVGDCSVEGVRAVCYRMPDAQVRAVLGLSFLQQFRATLSIKENSLELADP